MPNPPGSKYGPYSTNIRNVNSVHWQPWLKPESRCLVPVTSFSEYAPEPNLETGKKDIVWFSLNDERPLFAFAGIWREWTGTRGTKAKPETGDHTRGHASSEHIKVLRSTKTGWICEALADTAEIHLMEPNR